MANFLFSVMVILIFIIGIIIGVEDTQRTYHARCVNANPTVSVGDIDAFCKERLYLKD